MTDRDYREELKEWFESAPDWIEWKELDIIPSFESYYKAGESVPVIRMKTTMIHAIGQTTVDFTK